MYNWQQKDWKNFTYDISVVDDLLISFIEKVSLVNGMTKGLSNKEQINIILATMVSEAIKTSEIEGEYMSRVDVVSSIKNNLGLYTKTKKVSDKRAKGISALMIDVRNSYKAPLTRQKLFDWHKMLMLGNTSIPVGEWRKHTEPMQVVSGTLGKEKIHFEAPPSAEVPKEMKQFISWFNQTAPKKKNAIKHAPLRAAIAHLYFESIHPFADGNGRIGRAVAEKALSQTIGKPILLSLSQTIERDKKSYYKQLQIAQTKNELTEWIKYFISITIKAQSRTEEQIQFILQKTKFFDKYKSQINKRQLKVLNRMLIAFHQRFEGGMSAKKYMRLTKSSKATATRDLQQLKSLGIFKQIGSGRNTRYEVVLNN